MTLVFPSPDVSRATLLRQVEAWLNAMGRVSPGKAPGVDCILLSKPRTDYPQTPPRRLILAATP
ncbi:MAG: hypothetical protein ACK5F7_14765, partial [Planctomycetaceae bacterium]